ncbi:hypothetical protein HNQ07_002776 [Deinococcus metalli]|uniref:Uncharacterized protein n=1 Tax=Deinococcus metalli TaxID=1141878 RepID=A0A7W8KHJ2_9DEIO|nr:hypothetical protein [Deinococcus metalli]MBB5377303.1 hypothetical protein [Deinococcus metalli]GHF47508.1 hypothetical protein GCM10017781_24710 [Deinococcus metalli]
MNKLLMTAVAALTLTATTAFAAAPQAYATDDSGMEYTALQTESSWMAVEVPLTALGGSVPSDLSIAVSGLPEGTTIALDDVTTRGDSALLHVTVSRSNTTTAVNSVATIALQSGGDVLTNVSIPVYGAAYGE